MEDTTTQALANWKNNPNLDLSLVPFKARLELREVMLEQGIAFDRITPALVTAHIDKAIARNKTH